MACSDKDDEAEMAELSAAIPALLLPPEAELIGKSGGPDAIQLTYRSGLGAEQVVGTYRASFEREPWRLVNDATNPGGRTTLYIEYQGRPMWVSVTPESNGTGSIVEIAGAVVADSTVTAGR